MKDKVCFKSDTSAQILILTGFVIAVIIVGMGTVLYSVANSGQQTSILQSDRAYNNFENIREEYGIALMASSEKGEIDPFNVSNTTIILEFEDRMKTIVQSHGFILNFTRYEYFSDRKRGSVNILFTDGKKVFNDTVVYCLVTGRIIYDSISPGNITDLEAGTYPKCDGDGVVWLNWTAVGDDGYDEDTSANKYEVRYSNSSIDSLADFEDATQWGFLYGALKNGSEENRFVYGIDPGNWYFAVRVYDEAGNPSNISNDVEAVPSGWGPEIYNITANNETSNFTKDDHDQPNLFAIKDDNITIRFQVRDRDNDNVTISLMVRNRTLLPTGWVYGDWFEGHNWSMGNYSEMILSYSNLTEINQSWDYYFNVTDNSPCDKMRSDPLGAPYNYYSIEFPYKKYKTVEIDWRFVNDTYIIEGSNINYGHTELINIKLLGGKYRHGLIKFNISSIAGLNVEFANISLYVNSTSNDPIYFYKINTPWDEYIFNDTSPITTNATLSTFCTATAVGYMNCTISNDEINYLQNNPNYGWLITVTGNNQFAELDSKEAANASRRPVLYVTYST